MSRGRAIEMTGLRFGSLTVLRQSGLNGRQYTWLCRCDCGSERTYLGGNLRRGHSSSCGCQKANLISERISTHGLSKTPTYKIWKDMVKRCVNENHASFPRYGGRGITVCDRWRHSFENFLADMGERPVGASIDRIDNDKGYASGNCRWASTSEQARNRRSNIVIEYRGEKKCLTAWAEEFGLSPRLLHRRIVRDGWKIEDAITRKVCQ